MSDPILKPSDRMFLPPKSDYVDFDEPPGENGAHPLSALRRPSSFTLPPDDDPNTILGNRYLSRGDGAVLVGTSGMGKSSLSLQFAYLSALGRPFFGIQTHQPRRVLLVQSEDSEGDVAEICLSIQHCLNLSAQDLSTIDHNLAIVTERVLRGLAFVANLRKCIQEHQPDLVILNPLQAYMDGDVTLSQDLGLFLRERLNALNTPPRFAYLIVHHTTKPATGKDRHERLWHEVMYDMAGGAEIINWARAILSLRPTESEGDFNLVLAKRGRRAGLTRRIEDGLNTRTEPNLIIPLRHAKGTVPTSRTKPLSTIFWEERAADVPKTDPDGKITGRPVKYEYNDYRTLFPPKSSSGMEMKLLHRALMPNGDVEKKNFGTVLKRWAEEGHIEVLDVQGQPRRYRAAF